MNALDFCSDKVREQYLFTNRITCSVKYRFTPPHVYSFPERSPVRVCVCSSHRNPRKPTLTSKKEFKGAPKVYVGSTCLSFVGSERKNELNERCRYSKERIAAFNVKGKEKKHFFQRERYRERRR
ncbi:hypothetical protein TNCV_1184641 [Trichonephila clavipes]|nr:hypothetical protein TNCV_1184641 [Trichonephila clavipes]